MAAKTSEAPSRAPIAGSALDLVMAILATAVVAAVGWTFSFDVNRVFDVPKAVALKTGGAGLFIAWLLIGIAGYGWPWRSAKLFAAPALALLGVVFVSTVTSLDPWMSLQGVYERQFGLQGLVSCVGLYFVMATTLRSRRGAVAALGALAVVGGVIGAYALLQAYGKDPFGFFKAPNTKVYSTLGNATFAGNALALIFPITLILSIVASVVTLQPARWKPAPGHPMVLVGSWFTGIVVVALLLVLPGWTASGDGGLTADTRQDYMKLGIGLAVLGTIALALVGTWGPEAFRFESEGARRWADATLAGAMVTFALAIAAGLWFTRTRGAWVGTAIAIAGGLVLLPNLFSDDRKRMVKMRITGVGFIIVAVLGIASFVVKFPNKTFSITILSIPHAFSGKISVYGQGQGTRPYLWKESPLVLTNHAATLERQAIDRDDLRVKAQGKTKLERGEPSLLKRILVWPLGIGIETYRYAFMSHKSKTLEALDPMTNHDNPHNNYLYVLASCGLLGLAAYLWLLWRLLSIAWQKFNGEGSRTERALAFGVVTSFFSYAVYSIAGFDSVACSVFLYYLLGATAVLFEPALAEPRKSPLEHLSASWRAWRKKDGTGFEVGFVIGAIVLLLLCAQTVYSARQINEAEHVFVGRSERRTFEQRVQGMKDAIKINPRESFYWQSLGGLYVDASRQYKEAAARSEREGAPDVARSHLTKMREMVAQGEKAMYAALDHAWAPENIFISLFQMYYGLQRYEDAERALERALQHSPHLGPVRANLAVLKLERGAYPEALADCRWVLEVEPDNMMALRTCGRAAQKLGDFKEARRYLEHARTNNANDKGVLQYLREIEDAEKTKTGSVASP